MLIQQYKYILSFNKGVTDSLKNINQKQNN